MTLAAKALPEQILAPQAVFFRSLFMVLVIGVWAHRTGQPIIGRRRRKLLLVRGLFGTAGFLTYFTALKLIPLADTVTIFQSHPLIVSLLSPLCLGERNRPLQWALIGISFIGVAVVVRPMGEGEWTGRLVALSCAVLSAISYIIIRKVREDESPLTIAIAFPLVATMLIGPLLLSNRYGFRWVPPAREEWLLLGAVAVFSMFGQVLLTIGLGMVPAARGTAVSNSQVLYALLFGWLIFHEAPSTATMIGATIIITALFILAGTQKKFDK